MSIHDKEGVLDELRSSLYICEAVLRISETNGEPAEARVAAIKRADRFREAIRVIDIEAASRPGNAVDALKMPKYAKDDIERTTCRRCGASKGASCFKPQLAAVIAAVAFEGETSRTEFCYERVHDYFDMLRGGRGR